MIKFMGNAAYDKIEYLMRRIVQEVYFDTYIVTDRPEVIKEKIKTNMRENDGNVFVISYQQFIDSGNEIIGPRDNVYIDDLDRFLETFCNRIKGYTLTSEFVLVEGNDENYGVIG